MKIQGSIVHCKTWFCVKYFKWRKEGRNEFLYISHNKWHRFWIPYSNITKVFFLNISGEWKIFCKRKRHDKSVFFENGSLEYISLFTWTLFRKGFHPVCVFKVLVKREYWLWTLDSIVNFFFFFFVWFQWKLPLLCPTSHLPKQRIKSWKVQLIRGKAEVTNHFFNFPPEFCNGFYMLFSS